MMRRISLVVAFGIILIFTTLFTFLVPAGPALAADWGQAADDGIAGGFKLVNSTINCQVVFGAHLYAGTSNGNGCEVWRYDGTSWSQVVGQDPAGTTGTGPGFGNSANDSASSMAIYNNQLYVGTTNTNGCEVWRSPDGTTWNHVPGGSLGAANFQASSMAAFGASLYVGTNNTNGCEVWEYNGAAWNRRVGAGGLIGAGFGTANNSNASAMAVYGANLCVGTINTNGCEVWSSLNGANWGLTPGGGGGLGVPTNTAVRCMIAYGGNLLAGTQNSTNGCEVRAFNGAAWVPWVTGGIWNPINFSASSMAVYGGSLHVGTSNASTGCEVWSTPAGVVWSNVGGTNLGLRNWSASSMASYGGKLYVGTGNPGPGGEVWSTAGVGGVPYTDWTKTNVTGFALNTNDTAQSMLPFMGNLYVGTSTGNGCQIWRFDGSSWEMTNTSGFGDETNYSALCMAEFKGHIYAGTNNGFTGGQVWRSADGTGWDRVDVGTFGLQNYSITSMAVYKDHLHIGTNNSGGCQVWRTSDGTTWTRVDGGSLIPNNNEASSMVVYKDRLYVGTMNIGGTGCTVWGTRGTGGIPYTDWVQVNAGGFGDFNNTGAETMAVHDGQFYVGTNNNAGCQVWRTAADAPTFVDWSQAGSTAFGDTNNHSVTCMESWNGMLYAGTRNGVTGCEVWSWDGSAWAQEDSDGFGDSTNNEAASATVYFNGLFVGTMNLIKGCQVWNTGSTWYLAEGATTGGFETWVLVQNPGDVPVHVDFTLNTEAGEEKPADLQGVDIPAGTRRSFNMGNWATTFNLSTRVQAADGPVICERAMYWTPEGQANRELGHDSIGVNSPAPTWYLAEGATEGGFETWVLVQNPGANPVHVDFTLNTDTGVQNPPELQGVEVPAGSRRSFNLGSWVTTYDVSTRVDCTDGDVICERAIYWTPPGQANRVLGHDSVGVNSTSAVWYLAEGATEGGFETWVLVQNPGATPVHVDFTLNTEAGEEKPADLQGVEIPAGSRRSFNLGSWATTYDVSTRVECTDGEVICERAMYWTPEGQPYRELGHDSVGVTAPSAVWYMAEGATRGGFETWVLVQNPGATPVHVDFTLNTDAGEVKPADLQDLAIPAGSRISFNMGLYEETFDLSSKVTARDGLIICERAMYWTPEGQLYRELGHDSVGYSP